MKEASLVCDEHWPESECLFTLVINEVLISRFLHFFWMVICIRVCAYNNFHSASHISDLILKGLPNICIFILNQLYLNSNSGPTESISHHIIVWTKTYFFLSLINQTTKDVQILIRHTCVKQSFDKTEYNLKMML